MKKIIINTVDIILLVITSDMIIEFFIKSPVNVL